MKSSTLLRQNINKFLQTTKILNKIDLLKWFTMLTGLDRITMKVQIQSTEC